jgi:hypothetical protein
VACTSEVNESKNIDLAAREFNSDSGNMLSE